MGLGGFFGWLGDSRSDLLCIRLIREDALPTVFVRLVWNLAVAMGLAAALALCTQPTPARATRILCGGFAAAIGGYVAGFALMPLQIALALTVGRNAG